MSILPNTKEKEFVKSVMDFHNDYGVGYLSSYLSGRRSSQSATQKKRSDAESSRVSASFASAVMNSTKRILIYP